MNIHSEPISVPIPSRYKEPLEEEVLQYFKTEFEKKEDKYYVTNEYGRFLYDVLNKRVFLIYRRTDIHLEWQVLEKLSLLIELCRKNNIEFIYEPEISN